MRDEFLSVNKPSRWLQSLFDRLDAAITTESGHPSVGYCWQVAKKGKLIDLRVVPLEIEVVYGPEDGSKYLPETKVCISQIAQLFDSAPHIDWWRSPSAELPMDGAALILRGKIRNRLVHIHLLEDAVEGFAPGIQWNSHTKKYRRKGPDE